MCLWMSASGEIKLSQTVWELWPAQYFGFRGDIKFRLSLLTVTEANQMREVLLCVCSKMAETNLSSKLPVADSTREV